jgi:hypothetical protein
MFFIYKNRDFYVDIYMYMLYSIGMKFITLRGGKTFHIVKYHAKKKQYDSIGSAFCGKWAARYRDELHESVPSGRLCKKCRASYLQNHTEQELFLELI